MSGKTYTIRVTSFGGDKHAPTVPQHEATKTWTLFGQRQHAEQDAEAYATTQRRIGREVTNIEVTEEA